MHGWAYQVWSHAGLGWIVVRTGRMLKLSRTAVSPPFLLMNFFTNNSSFNFNIFVNERKPAECFRSSCCFESLRISLLRQKISLWRGCSFFFFPLFYTLKLLNALDINSYLEKDVTVAGVFSTDSSTWFEGNMICHSRDSPFFFSLLHGRVAYIRTITRNDFFAVFLKPS